MALPNVSCEYEVSDLNAKAKTGPRTTRSERFPLVVPVTIAQDNRCHFCGSASIAIPNFVKVPNGGPRAVKHPRFWGSFAAP